MTTALLLILLALVFLYFGAEGLVRGSASLALRAGVTPLVVGLTVVAFGTSMPELVVSVKATLSGMDDIALGNVVGSNIFNIAVILGLSAVIQPMRVRLQLLKFDTPIALAVSVLLMVFFRDGVLQRAEAGILFAGILLYTVVNLIMARRERSREMAEEFEEGVPHRHRHVAVDLLFLAGGLVLLVAGANFFVDGAVYLARLWGVSEAVIGLTIVAAGTSLPELATSVVAAVRKEEDIAIGNIVGSNIFNVLCIMGCSGMIRPLHAGGVAPVDFQVMIAVTVALALFMRTGFRITRLEGVLLLASYGGYLWWLWP